MGSVFRYYSVQKNKTTAKYSQKPNSDYVGDIRIQSASLHYAAA